MLTTIILRLPEVRLLAQVEFNADLPVPVANFFFFFGGEIFWKLIDTVEEMIRMIIFLQHSVVTLQSTATAMIIMHSTV